MWHYTPSGLAEDIRQLNNMSSDYAVYSRRRLLIPVALPQLLWGQICVIEYDEYAQRELAVIYLQGRMSKGKGLASQTADASMETAVKQEILALQRISHHGLEHLAERSIAVVRDEPALFKRNYSNDSELLGAVTTLGLNLKMHSASNLEVTRQVEGVEATVVSGQGNEEGDRVLTDDLWRSILERLSVRSLGCAACVCRLWHSIAGDPAVLAAAFTAPWKLREVVGKPTSSSFWRGQLGQFAISHALQRQDTIAGLAVKYGVQVPEIRRVNNMMSEHGIHSRERLLIPVTRPEILDGQTCYIETDIYAKREVAVLYLDGTRPDKKEAHARATARVQRKLKREIMESLKRSLRVDDSTAQYYFALAEGDLRGALQEFSDDMQWEHTAR
jgi:hypothetical protein